MKNLKTNKRSDVLLQCVTLLAISGTFCCGLLLFLCFDQEIFTVETYDGTYAMKSVQYQALRTDIHTYVEALGKINVENKTEEEMAVVIQNTFQAWNYNLLEKRNTENSNLQVKLVDNRTGMVIFDLFGEMAYSKINSATYFFNNSENCTFYYGLQAELPVKDQFFTTAKGFEFLKGISHILPIYLVVSGTFAVIMMTVLMKRTYQAKENEEVASTFFEKIPTDLGCVISLLLVLIPCALLSDIFQYERLGYLGVLLSPTQPHFIEISFIFSAALLLLSFILVKIVEMFCSRVKRQTFIKNTIVWRVSHFLWKIVERFIGNIKKLPIIWRTVLFGLVICGINGVLGMFSMESGFTWFLFALYNLVILSFFCGLALQMKLLQAGAESLVTGNFQEKIDTKKMYLDCKKYGETLNQIGDSIGEAVEDKLRSQRMKTELITNVSHDIKTPLTSIVTCVELLQKEQSEEQREEHLQLLQRQSMRMKKLVEDLVEASKVTTGNLSIDFVEMNVVEAVQQALGEYEEKFSEKELQIVSTYQENCMVQADGKQFWRVLDNVLSNVYKYAQTGTRVYVSVEKSGENTEIFIKNISAEPLNVKAEELLERFVRGDLSRSTEGSGLGLHIAQSLMQLQGGELVLSIDGDLVKVALSFS